MVLGKLMTAIGWLFMGIVSLVVLAFWVFIVVVAVRFMIHGHLVLGVIVALTPALALVVGLARLRGRQAWAELSRGQQQPSRRDDQHWD